jgi:hypothetical protein
MLIHTYVIPELPATVNNQSSYLQQKDICQLRPISLTTLQPRSSLTLTL